MLEPEVIIKLNKEEKHLLCVSACVIILKCSEEQ